VNSTSGVVSELAASHPHILVWLEPLVVGGFTILFTLYALMFFKQQHIVHHPTRVLVGAAIQGFIIGALVGFVILPFRVAFFVPDPSLVPDAPTPPKGIASLAILPAFLLLLVVRQGLGARAPLVGRYLRAYRRAAIMHQIDGAKRALARLEKVDARAKAEGN
jgi:hypothetical protein